MLEVSIGFRGVHQVRILAVSWVSRPGWRSYLSGVQDEGGQSGNRIVAADSGSSCRTARVCVQIMIRLVRYVGGVT